MSWQADIYAAVQASNALVALIGNRFSWDIADGSTVAPYLVAQAISGSGTTDHGGKRELSFPLIQITAWAATKAAAIAVIATVKNELEGINLPGPANVSLAYAGEQSTYDRESKLYGEIIEFRASCNTN